MKRDRNLQDLSRDHHRALVVARSARRAAATGTDDEVASMWTSIAVAFDAELDPHFEIEEQLLLLPMETAGADALVRRTRSDHDRLRALLSETGEDRPRLAEFGELLRAHVRFEEQELFPAAEKMLTPAELATVAQASAATPVSRVQGKLPRSE